MKQRFIVAKFGGTSVSSVKCWSRIAAIIRDRQNKGFKPIVVCSAVAGISNELEKAINEALTGSHGPTLLRIEKVHNDLAAELDVGLHIVRNNLEELSSLFKKIADTGKASAIIKAKIMAHGELMSTMLGAAYLKNSGIDIEWRDARTDLIAKKSDTGNSDREMLSASCDYDTDDRLIKEFSSCPEKAIVTQGFIASDPSGNTVLLGRGGSDVSASYFAAKLGAEVCEIWTDVPGMYTANPKQIPSARLIRELDYDEAQEIASFGAKVLHPKCLAPVRKQKIPLKIFCLDRPDIDGTSVTSDAVNKDAQVKAISSKKGVTLVAMESVDMWQQVGFLADVFACFKKNGLSIDLISTSETNVTVTLDQTTNVLTEAAIKSLANDLSSFCQVRVVDQCAIVSLVGRKIRSILPQLAPVLEVFEEQKIYLMSQAANDLNLTFVVDEEQAERLVKQLHEQIFKQFGNDDLLGKSYQELFDNEPKKAKGLPDTWWLDKKDALISLARRSSPLYVYDEETLERSLKKVSMLKSIDRVFYSVKANNNEKILKKFEKGGIGFECVSRQEVAHLFKIFPGIAPGRILFTPNFAGKDEYEYAFKKGVMVTLDNLYPLKMWPKMLKDSEILLRIDPGHGQGHHKYVRTAGIRSKFGISSEQFDEMAALVKKSGARVKGLHAHVGSNIFTPDTWSKTALFLSSVAKLFDGVEIFDLGGGLGVVEKPGKNELDMHELDAQLSKIKLAHPKYKLWIEPGRFMVAEAGVLLARVTQVKKKGEYNYIGIDTGMNTLIRPALYGAHHEIVNISKLDRPADFVANVVGPICESGDILGYERLMPTPDEGDIILIATTGAYGRVMSSNYNMREPAAEHFLTN